MSANTSFRRTSSFQFSQHPKAQAPSYFRIDTEKRILDLIKRGERVVSALALSSQSESSSSKLTMLQKLSLLLKKSKYCKHISLEGGLVSNEALIAKSLKCLRKATGTKKLTLICQNSSIDDRVRHSSTLKPLRRMRRLETVQFNIFFNPASRALYSRFGTLVKYLNVKSLTVKEPLTLASDRLSRRFYMQAKRASSRLRSLALTTFTPVEDPIEKYVPYRITRRARDLKELYLNFVGVCMDNKSFGRLLVLLREMNCLSALGLDLSFNKVSCLEDLNKLGSLDLCHIRLNLSYCPLVENSAAHISRLIKGNPKLRSVEILVNSANMTQADVFQLAEALSTLEDLRSVNIALSGIECLDARNLWRFLNQFMKAPLLSKASFNLSQALCMGCHPDPSSTPLRSTNLKCLQLNLNNNRIREVEMAFVIDYFKFCSGIEHLKLSLDSCRLNGKGGEAICRWVASLENLKYLEISMRSADMNEVYIDTLLKGLTTLKIQDLRLDITDTEESLYSTKALLDAIGDMKKIKSLKLVSTDKGVSVPSLVRETFKKKLPEYIRYEIC